MIRRSIALTALCALALAACNGDEGAGGTTGTTATGSPSPTTPGAQIQADGLEAILLQPGEAPQGTEFQPDLSGAQTLEEYAGDEQERAQLQQAGFEGAYTRVFADPALMQAEDPQQAPDGSTAAIVTGLVFPTAANATRAFAWYRDTWIPQNTEGLQPLSADRLGEDAYGLTFDSFAASPYPGTGYIWKVNNAVFTVLVARKGGSPSPDQVLPLAQRVDQRARGRA